MGKLCPKRPQEPNKSTKNHFVGPPGAPSWRPCWGYVGPCWSYVGTFELQVGSEKAILSNMKLKMAKDTPQMLQLSPT